MELDTSVKAVLVCILIIQAIQLGVALENDDHMGYGMAAIITGVLAGVIIFSYL